MSQADRDLKYLRGVFGDEAESIYRGLAIASRDLDLSDALTLVLQVRDQRQGTRLDGIELQIADAMRNPPGRGVRDETVEDLAGGARPFARLRQDYPTSLGVFRAGHAVRIVDRLSDGQILVEALDVNGTVFPVPDALLDPSE